MAGHDGRKILVIGTLGSGKTTVAQMLSKAMGYSLASIDLCRERFGDNTVTGEYRAWTCFVESCNDQRPAILEFSGGGPHAYAVRQALRQSGLPAHVIWLDPPLDICIKRASSRVKNVPTPYPWGSIDESTRAIYAGIDAAWREIWYDQPDIIAARISLKGTESISAAFKIVIDLIKGDSITDTGETRYGLYE